MMDWKKFWIQSMLVAVAFGSLGFLQNLNVKPIGSDRIDTINTSLQEMMGNETSSMER